MARPLKFEKVKQPPEDRQTNEPHVGSSARIAITSPRGTPQAQDSSTTGSGGSHLPPTPSLTGTLAPETVELPRRLDIGGFLYQRVDNFSGDEPMNPSNLLGSSAHMPPPQDHLPRLDGEQHNELPESVSSREPETSQPVTTGSSQSARSKRNRESKLVRELEAHNKSPVPISDSEEDELFVRQSDKPEPKRKSKVQLLVRQPETPEQKRQSKMLRELEAHNHSPEPKSELAIKNLLDLESNWGDLGLTRGARKDLEDILNGKTPTPKTNLNVKKLMLDQFSGKKKDTKTFEAEGVSEFGIHSYQRQQKCMDPMDENESEEEDLFQNFSTIGRDYPEPIPAARRRNPRQVKVSMGNSQRDEDVLGLVWPILDKQKERICELLESPRYNPHPSQHELDAQARRKPAYHVTAEVSQSLQGAFHMDGGVYVFTPTPASFSDFGAFLKDVEDIAGRKLGVVKVIVPSESLERTPFPVGSKRRTSRPTGTTVVNVSLNANATEEPCKVYNISTTDGISFAADEWLRRIKSDRARIITERFVNAKAISRNDVWKESHVLEPYTETKMIHHGLKPHGGVVCALSQPAISNLRGALQCKDPHIFDLLGNRFAGSRSTEPGINESVFHIAGGKGPLSPLQTNKYAAYSLNYHHSGAPRIITVTAPKHFGKLEEFMYIAQNGGSVLGRPWNPPKCSQFVKHQPMYVPHATLSLNGVEYTEVVQHQGEMVIIFPYAYHQGYTSGPNITEEVLYASDRCKVFHRENLYHHCNDNCAGGQHDDFDLKLVFNNTLETPHRRRQGQDYLTSLSTDQSQDASITHSNGSDGGLPKRLPGFSSWDRISDGGGEWLPSAQGFEPGSSTRRKTARLTSNPYEPDMWDPDSLYEPTYGQASEDEDTPTGGTPRGRGRGRGGRGRKRGDSSSGTPRKRRTR